MLIKLKEAFINIFPDARPVLAYRSTFKYFKRKVGTVKINALAQQQKLTQQFESIFFEL